MAKLPRFDLFADVEVHQVFSDEQRTGIVLPAAGTESSALAPGPAAGCSKGFRYKAREVR